MFQELVNIWQRWGLKAGFSVTEQGLLSGGNFILNVLLIRWLLPAQYGAFAIAFSIFLFLSGFHNALILEPMSVIGVSRYKEQLSQYLRITVYIHCVLTLGFVGIMALVASIMAMGRNVLTPSFFGLAISTPFILFFWLFRQACYIETKPDLALKGSLFYVILLITGIVIIKRQNWLSPFSAFIIMALASIIASIAFWRFLNMKVNDSSVSFNNLNIGAVLLDHWHYGKWVVGSAFVNWLSSLVYLPLIGIFAGLTQAGVFMAMQNLVLPLQRTLTALELLLLPWFSKQQAIQGKGYLKKKLPKMISINVVIACGYVILLLLFGRWVIKFLYGQYYISFLWLLPYLGVIAVIGACRLGFSIGLKASERPDAIFWSQAAGTLLTLTLGLYLVYTLKLYGAVVGSVLTTILMTIVLFHFLWSHWKRTQ